MHNNVSISVILNSIRDIPHTTTLQSMNYVRNFKTALILSLAGTSSVATATDGLTISHLGPNNTIVRVSNDNRYLLLPVEENVGDASLNLLLDGKLETTIYVRLARNHIDYFVPVDLSRYADKEILFNIVTPVHTGQHTDSDVCWEAIKLSDNFNTENTEKYRPAFHHTPLYGWMNDPNGMFYKDGVWHLYYQYNPYGSKWQNMTWGHSSSTDLINWHHQPIAIEPNALGSVFSGSCAIDEANTAGFGTNAVIALYTSAGTSQMQSLAHSNDNGLTFDIYPGNPVLTLSSEARDPNMFWNAEAGLWNIILAHPLDHEMLIFTSPDLKEWSLQSEFGRGLGAQDGVWECPDLMRLPVNGTDEYKWVLISNINPGGPFGGSATQYFVGDFDGRTFTVDTPPSGIVPTKWMDFGKDHYATVSWSDAPNDRNVVIGWMSNWQYAAEVPTREFRSANTLPRDISLFKGSDGEYYISTLPAPETDALRGKKMVTVKSKNLRGKAERFALPENGLCEIDLTLNAQKATAVRLTLSNPKGEEVVMTFDPTSSSFSFDRTRSGLVDFSMDFPAVVTAPTLRTSSAQSLRIFIDRSSIEIFDSEGNFVLTNLVFPTEPYISLSIEATGGKAVINSLDIYSINTTDNN